VRLTRKTRVAAKFVFDPCATLLYLARSFTEIERLGPTLV